MLEALCFCHVLPTYHCFFLQPVELWTGKQVFNVLVRPSARTRIFINLVVKERFYTKSKVEPEHMCPADGYVCFRNSDLISGQVGKATLGAGNKNGLFTVLLRDYCAEVRIKPLQLVWEIFVLYDTIAGHFACLPGAWGSL